VNKTTEKIMLKQVKREIVESVPLGYWIVTFDTIWGQSCNEGQHNDCLEHGCMDNEPSYIAEIESIVTKITKNNYLTLDYDYAIKTMNSSEYVSGDTHDLRPRLFKTKKEATEYAKHVKTRFDNPSPWEVFVKQ
jgi:hypothetical protein